MKVKDAIIQIQASADPDSVSERLRKLYRTETVNRIKLRSHGAPTSSVSLTEGVIKEMDDWIVKVARGIGISDDAAEHLRQEEKELMINRVKLAVFIKRTGGEP